MKRRRNTQQLEELSDLKGSRSDAVGFTIGDKAYIGTSYDGSDRLNDFGE
jgi:hypothetical protein